MVGEVVFTVPRWASAGAHGRLGLTHDCNTPPCQPGISATPRAGLGSLPWGREIEAFAVLSCLFYLETQASRVINYLGLVC